VPNNIYASGNNISSDLGSIIRSFIATQKELSKEFIGKFEKMDTLCEKVDNISREFNTLKNFIQRKRSHEKTMKYCEEVLEKTWETARIFKARNKENDKLN
jgi:hypothetical protein